MGCQSSDILNAINSISQQPNPNHPQPNRNSSNPNQYNQQQNQPSYAQPVYAQQQPNYQQPPNYQQQQPQNLQSYQQPQAQQPNPQSNQHQPQQQNYPIQVQTQQIQSKSGNNPSVSIVAAQLPKKPLPPRQFMQSKVNSKEDFETHHLKYELSLSQYSSKSRIKKRQIVEHLMLINYWGKNCYKDMSFSSYFQSLLMSFIQRNFLDIWDIGHDQLFNQHIEQKVVRRKIAEQFMFEIYELKEYVDSGLANLNAFIDKTRCNLNQFMIVSDFALFSAFKKLKDKYPQTSETEKIEFPKVQSTKTNYNLLEHFQSKCFADPKNINLQTVYDDLKYMFNKAIQLEQNFKTDMKDMLGQKTLACAKVNITKTDGVPQFNACAVRRVFVKWAENLIQLFPEIKSSKGFTKFTRIKNQLANNFFFKSQIQETTHKKVIQCICEIIQVAKYHLKDGQKRKEFLFNIYDLLRCKIKKSSAEEVVGLYNKMLNTKVTKSGQKFQVLRVKNRFKTNNRDLLVNYKYGDLIVGEAQLCIDNANVSKQAKLNYEFCHYIYELERSLFGPTLELMMSYEDFQRPDISVNFQAEGIVQPRGNQNIQDIQKTDRTCMLGHTMVSLVGNYIIGDDPAAELQCTCDYCGRNFTTKDRFEYCFFCSNSLCRNCSNDYKANFKHENSWISILRDQVLIKIQDKPNLINQCKKNKALSVLFYAQGTTSSNQLFKDCLTFHQSKLVSQQKAFIPKVAFANVNTPAVKAICDQLEITQFPTLVLYDGNANPIRYIIGFCWLQVPIIYHTQQQMLEKGSFQLQIHCLSCEDQAPLEFKNISEIQNLICLYCLNNSKLDLVTPEYQILGGFCSSNHYRCIACCYAASDKPSAYKDYTGGYLSSPIVVPNLKKCPKGHSIQLIKKNPSKIWQYSCFSCKQKHMFDDENGIGHCESCKVSLCPNCMGFPRSLTLQQLDKMPYLAIHYAQSSAEEGVFCVCKQPFKKAYTTRALKAQDIAQKKKWACFLCKQQKEDELHVGCFNCPSFKEAFGQKYNFQICYSCAQKSQILMRSQAIKTIEQPSFFVCQKNHAMVKTSIPYDSKTLYISCMFCKNNYYNHTQRIYCKTCNINCCNNCKGQLVNAHPPRCNHTCSQNHSLNLFYTCQTLKFCDVCFITVKGQHFNCQQCAFDLCLTCARKPGQLNYNAKLADVTKVESDWLNFNLNFGQALNLNFGQAQQKQSAQSEEGQGFGWGDFW